MLGFRDINPITKIQVKHGTLHGHCFFNEGGGPSRVVPVDLNAVRLAVCESKS